MGRQATVAYNLSKNAGTFNNHKDKYSTELIQFIQDELAEQLYYFGYVMP